MHRAALSASTAVEEGVRSGSACERREPKEMKDAEKAFLLILSVLLYSVCQGLAVRGQDDAESSREQKTAADSSRQQQTARGSAWQWHPKVVIMALSSQVQVGFP